MFGSLVATVSIIVIVVKVMLKGFWNDAQEKDRKDF